MTPEEYRKLDYKVAEKVMGWKRDKLFRHSDVWIAPTGEYLNERDIPYYGSDIADAWNVAIKLNRFFQLEQYGSEETGWLKYKTTTVSDKLETVIEYANTPALAICLVALKAVEDGTG